jgi:5-methylthioadenosine/S-adenosylhomocysteine deaminase
MATIEGARAIGLDTEVGSLEVGKQADIVVLDTGRPHLVPMYHPASLIVYAAVGADVRDVFIAGKPVVRNRKLQTLDIDTVMKRMNTRALAVCSRA